MLSRIFVTLPIVLFVFWGFGFFWNSCHQRTIMCFSIIALQPSHDICALSWSKISHQDEREIYSSGSEIPILHCLPLFLSLFTASSCWTGISYKCWYLHRAIDSNLNICLKLCVELDNLYTSYVNSEVEGGSGLELLCAELKCQRKSQEKREGSWMNLNSVTNLVNVMCLKWLTCINSHQFHGQQNVASYNLMLAV